MSHERGALGRCDVLWAVRPLPTLLSLQEATPPSATSPLETLLVQFHPLLPQIHPVDAATATQSHAPRSHDLAPQHNATLVSDFVVVHHLIVSLLFFSTYFSARVP